jgi:hypothetical protein
MHFVRKDYVRLNAGEAFTEALKLMLTGIELEQPKAAGGGAKKTLDRLGWQFSECLLLGRT